MGINLNKLIRDIVFVLLLVYYAQTNFLLPDYSFLKVSIIFYLMTGVIIFSIVFLSNFNRILIFSFSLFIILQVFYFIISDPIVISPFYKEHKTITSLIRIMIIFFSFYISHYYSKKGMISIKYLIVLYLIVFCMTVFSFYINANLLILEKDVEDITNNVGYTFVLLLPFLFLFKKNIISLSLLLLSLFFIIISAKRGAILIGTVFVFFYVYKVYLINSKNKTKSFFYTIFIFLSLVFFVHEMFLSSDYLQKRFLSTIEGNLNGRDIIFSYLWNNWISSDSIITYLFGSGLLTPVASVGFHAHNDWLELLTCTGLFGITIYFFIFYEIYQFAQFRSLNKHERNIILSFLLIWFMKSLFSMGYSAVNMAFPFILLGYIYGKHNNEKCMTISTADNYTT